VLKFAILLVGALTGFMIFNLKGKIFMGDSGSYLTGFVVSALSVMLVTRNPDVSPFAPLLIVFVPVFDTLYAIWRRKRLGNDPFKADKMHFHHMMRVKYRSDGKAVIVILLVQSGAALAAILLEGNTVVLAGMAVFMVFFLQRLWLGGLKTR
jgi:UDP-N-acetylmuramyl pentapeptide phosphotransferase/UDP-N-acetylglucosamine-1-phosphate transferase